MNLGVWMRVKSLILLLSYLNSQLLGSLLSGIVKTHAYTDYLATKSASDIMLNVDNIDYLSEFTDILVSNVDDYDQKFFR